MFLTKEQRKSDTLFKDYLKGYIGDEKELVSYLSRSTSPDLVQVPRTVRAGPYSVRVEIDGTIKSWNYKKDKIVKKHLFELFKEESSCPTMVALLTESATLKDMFMLNFYITHNKNHNLKSNK